YDLDQLRAAIQYRAWVQKDPLIEYKQDAYDMFVGLMNDVRATFAERWLKLQIEVAPPEPRGRTATGPASGGQLRAAVGSRSTLISAPGPRRDRKSTRLNSSH